MEPHEPGPSQLLLDQLHIYVPQPCTAQGILFHVLLLPSLVFALSWDTCGLVIRRPLGDCSPIMYV